MEQSSASPAIGILVSSISSYYELGSPPLLSCLSFTPSLDSSNMVLTSNWANITLLRGVYSFPRSNPVEGETITAGSLAELSI